MLRICLNLGLSWLLVWPLPATAQESRSQAQVAAGNELLQAGKDAYIAGRFADAVYDFEQAYQRLQSPFILYRIGDAADKLGDHERAVSALRQYLIEQPGARDRAFIESRIQANLDALRQQQPAPQVSPKAAADSTAEAPGGQAPAAATKPAHNPAGPWWVWAGAGTLAIASIVVVAVLVGNTSPPPAAPVKGNVGEVVQTLAGP